MAEFRMTLVVVSATLFLTGTALTWAAADQTQNQKQGQEEARKQAIESVKKRLKESPRDEGLRHAEQCLERSNRCQDVRGLDQAMESVRHNMENHPDDHGLRHAMEQLEKHHRRLVKQHMERERPMHRESGRPERPNRHDGPEGMHR